MNHLLGLLVLLLPLPSHDHRLHLLQHVVLLLQILQMLPLLVQQRFELPLHYVYRHPLLLHRGQQFFLVAYHSVSELQAPSSSRVDRELSPDCSPNVAAEPE